MWDVGPVIPKKVLNHYIRSQELKIDDNNMVSEVILTTDPSPLVAECCTTRGGGGLVVNVDRPQNPPSEGSKELGKPHFRAFQSKLGQQNFSAFGRNFLLRNKGGGLVVKITTDSFPADCYTM